MTISLGHFCPTFLSVSETTRAALGVGEGGERRTARTRASNNRLTCATEKYIHMYWEPQKWKLQTEPHKACTDTFRKNFKEVAIQRKYRLLKGYVNNRVLGVCISEHHSFLILQTLLSVSFGPKAGHPRYLVAIARRVLKACGPYPERHPIQYPATQRTRANIYTTLGLPSSSGNPPLLHIRLSTLKHTSA